MRPAQCAACRSDNLYYAEIRAVVSRKGKAIWWPAPLLQGAICLACGAVQSYLDDAGLKKVKAWEQKDNP